MTPNNKFLPDTVELIYMCFYRDCRNIQKTFLSSNYTSPSTKNWKWLYLIPYKEVIAICTCWKRNTSFLQGNVTRYMNFSSGCAPCPGLANTKGLHRFVVCFCFVLFKYFLFNGFYFGLFRFWCMGMSENEQWRKREKERKVGRETQRDTER